MKQQILYIHGGESFENHTEFLERLRTMQLWHLPTDDNCGQKKWTRTFADDLGDGYEVFMPPMPNKQNAKYEEWSIWFERHFEHLRDDVILIGCSLGAMFLAKYLNENTLPFAPKTAILMAGAYRIPGFDDKDCGDFLVKPEDLEGLTDKGHKVIIMHSKDDFLVPFEHGEALHKALPESEFIIFEDKNHFLIEEFPEILDLVQKL